MAKKRTSTTKSGSTFDAPQSRNEAILQNILGANNVLGEPQSRIEALLMQILEQGGGGSGAVDSVNGKTGAVVLDADDVGASPAPFEVTVTTAGAVSQECANNTIYTFTGALTSLTLTEASGAREYLVIFATGSTAPTVTFPSGVAFSDALTIEANKRYEVSVRDGYAVAQAWAVSA